MKNLSTLALLLPLLFLQIACEPEEEVPTGSGLFTQGCPIPNQATARQLKSIEERPEGPDALASTGDLLLMNEQAAFVIQGTGETRAYFHYPGVLIDAVAVEGCEQAAAERFGEQIFLVGRLDAAKFTRSSLHLFDGQKAEIINDGSNGEPAVVRVSGKDAPFWLAELELAKAARVEGEMRPLSKSLGIKVQVDYILAPGSSVLEMELSLQNTNSEETPIMGGALLIMGNDTPSFSAADSTLAVGGFGIRMGVPWLVADSGEGAYALSMDTSNMGTTYVSGVDALIDVRQATDAPLVLAPAGSKGDTATVRFFTAVGPSDGNSATRHLEPYQPGPREYTLEELSGTVLEAASGEPVPGAQVFLELRSGSEWQRLDSFGADKNGKFSGAAPLFFDSALSYRLRASAPGRHDLELPFKPGDDAKVKLAMGPEGRLGYRVNDGNGKAMPAKVSIYQEGKLVDRLYLADGHGNAPLAPGDYEISVTRGFEYQSAHQPIHVPAGASASLEVSLPRLVDTSGFLSLDGHVHAGPSPDSRIHIPQRLITAAAEGLEVVVGTDHEIITDWSYGIDEAGLRGELSTVVGQELTATVPEHINLYGVPVDETHPRGGPIRWYGKSVAELFDEAREQGARIISLNHPRLGCSYLCLIEWDRILGRPLLSDPRAIGLPKDAKLWSWNFDVIEYLNGYRSVFVEPGKEHATGLFDDWMSFHNHGHRITAVGVTDVHGLEVPGSPRSYFAAANDKPDEFSLDEFESSIKTGKVLVSAGAFARVSIGEAGMGDLAQAEGDGEEMGVDLKVRIEALPEIDVSHFKVYVNCDEVLRINASQPDEVVKFNDTIRVPIEQDSHVVLLAFGQNRLPRGLASFDPAQIPRVTTNPIFVDADGDGKFSPPGGKSCTYSLN